MRIARRGRFSDRVAGSLELYVRNSFTATRGYEAAGITGWLAAGTLSGNAPWQDGEGSMIMGHVKTFVSGRSISLLWCMPSDNRSKNIMKKRPWIC
jgi:hypothetical protein